MSKKLNEEIMASELAGSAFFRPAPPPASEAVSSKIEVTNQIASKPAKKERSTLENPQTNNEATKQTSKQVNQPASKAVKKIVSKPGRKFASYLPAADLKALKQIALDTDRHDYEVLREAVETYLELVGEKGRP